MVGIKAIWKHLVLPAEYTVKKGSL